MSWIVSHIPFKTLNISANISPANMENNFVNYNKRQKNRAETANAKAKSKKEIPERKEASRTRISSIPTIDDRVIIYNIRILYIRHRYIC